MAQDIVHADDVIIEGSACVSDDNACASGESFPSNADIKIKDALPRLLFEDTSSSTSPDRHYRIAVGDAGSGSEYFAIEDAGASGTGATQVFRVDGGAPANALRVDSSGDLGLGTATPAKEVHIADSDTPTLRLDQDGSGIFAAQSWDILASELGFRVRDVTNGNRTPFFIQGNTPTNSLYLEDDGEVGFGTSSPQFDLHVLRSSGATTVARIENTTASTIRLDLKSPNADWRFSNQNGPFAIREDGDPVNELTLNKAGDLIITGTLTTGGPSCGGGCDELFSPAIEVESIEEHATAMWENSHLPAVGPTAAQEPMNMSEKVGGLINELEKAHIYIDQINERLSEKEQQYMELRQQKDDLSQRMARLEALLLRTGGGD